MLIKLVLISVLYLILSPAFAADIPTIRSMMTEDDIEATGLDKLSESELEALRNWIDVFSDRDAKFVRQQYRKQLKQDQKNRIEQDGAIVKSGTKTAVVRVDTVNRKTGLVSSADKASADIVSTIDGSFEGWTGKTRFRLENGQIWQQRKHESRRSVKTVQNPRVIIKKNFLGFYVMTLPDLKVKIPVKRLQ